MCDGQRRFFDFAVKKGEPLSQYSILLLSRRGTNCAAFCILTESEQSLKIALSSIIFDKN